MTLNWQRELTETCHCDEGARRHRGERGNARGNAYTHDVGRGQDCGPSNIGGENFGRRSTRRRTIAMTNLIDRDGLDGVEVERDVVRVIGVSLLEDGFDLPGGGTQIRVIGRAKGRKHKTGH